MEVNSVTPNTTADNELEATTNDASEFSKRLPMYVNNADTVMQVLRYAEEKGCDVVLMRPISANAPANVGVITLPLFRLVKSVPKPRRNKSHTAV